MLSLSKYTTEVRYICENAAGLTVSGGYSDIDTILSSAISSIFSFDFPIFDENYRSVLEKKILKHYYTREIGEETVGLWKLRLDTKMNEIMPYYNKLYNSELLDFNPLYTANITRTRKTEYESEKQNTESINDTTSNTKSVNDTTTNNRTSDTTDNTTVTNRGTVATENSRTTSGIENSESTTTDATVNLYSDTPQGALTNVENETYLTNATKNTVNGTVEVDSSTSGSDNFTGNTTNTENNSTAYSHHNVDVDNGTYVRAESDNGTYARNRGATDDLNSTEDYLETVIGYEGANTSEMLLKYRETFLNIDMMIINDLEPLFMQLW